MQKYFKNILQCNVASEGIGLLVDVVRKELAPCSISIRILRVQNGTNFANVFSGFALAIHSTS